MRDGCREEELDALGIGLSCPGLCHVLPVEPCGSGADADCPIPIDLSPRFHRFRGILATSLLGDWVISNAMRGQWMTIPGSNFIINPGRVFCLLYV
jgi:hypothetical protein